MNSSADEFSGQSRSQPWGFGYEGLGCSVQVDRSSVAVAVAKATTGRDLTRCGDGGFFGEVRILEDGLDRCERRTIEICNFDLKKRRRCTDLIWRKVLGFEKKKKFHDRGGNRIMDLAGTDLSVSEEVWGFRDEWGWWTDEDLGMPKPTKHQI